jgi:hypothetical protein
MANTFELIASSTVGAGGASSIEFTSIPSTYTDLCVKIAVRSSDANTQTSMCYNFNGTTSGYTGRNIENYQGTVYSGTTTTLTVGGVVYGRLDDSGIPGSLATASTFNSGELYIPNYSGSTNKSWSYDVVVENNSTAGVGFLGAGLWSNTAAITSIKFIPYAGSFVQYSNIYLYGVKSS